MARRETGFTLIEVMLAVAITSVVMITVGTTFHVMLNARDVVDDLAESTEAGPRILNLIERDLRGMWTYNVHNNAVFRGRDADIGGRDADKMDFLTTTDAVGFVLDSDNVPRKPTVNEVGYWFKPNPRFREVFEMWRREDPMVDTDLITQGTFQLVHDRVKNFKITYYRTLGYEAEVLNEWDSAVEDALPKRLKIEFTIERKRSSRNVVSDVEIEDFEGAEKTYVRHIVFDRGFDQILAANAARIPVLPIEPAVPNQGPIGPAGPGGAGGAGGANGAMQANNGKGPGNQPIGAAQGQNGKGNGVATTSPGQPGQGAGRGGGQAGQGLPPGFNPGDLFRQISGGAGGGNGAGGLFGR